MAFTENDEVDGIKFIDPASKAYEEVILSVANELETELNELIALDAVKAYEELSEDEEDTDSNADLA